MALRVLFTPVSVNVTNAGQRFTVVNAGLLTLTAHGTSRSPNPVIPTPTAAVLEFLEMVAAGDTSRSPRSLGTLTGHLRMVGDVPKFDLHLATPVQPALVTGSDFRIGLDFDATTFENAHPAARLTLPWETASEGNNLEIGVRLTLDGAALAEPADNDRLDVPLTHRSVPEDGTSTSVRSPCFGCRTVYPDDNFLLTRAQRMPIGARALNVFVHDSVVNGCNRVTPGSFALQAFQTNLVQIMTSGGFTNVVVQQVDTAAATATTAPWARLGGRFVAKNVADPAAVNDTEGFDAPFFDFWVFHESSVAGGAEVGQSESLNPAGQISIRGITKRVITPVVLPSSTFDSFYRQVVASDQMNALADIIAHEIGHGLGLRHGLAFDGTSSYSLTSGLLLGTMTTEQVNGGRIPVKNFGPVHAGVIRRHFL